MTNQERDIRNARAMDIFRLVAENYNAHNAFSDKVSNMIYTFSIFIANLELSNAALEHKIAELELTVHTDKMLKAP